MTALRFCERTPQSSTICERKRLRDYKRYCSDSREYKMTIRGNTLPTFLPS